MSAALIQTYMRAVITMRRAQRRLQLTPNDDAVRAEVRCAEQMVDQLTNEMGKRVSAAANLVG